MNLPKNNLLKSITCIWFLALIIGCSSYNFVKNTKGTSANAENIIPTEESAQNSIDGAGELVIGMQFGNMGGSKALVSEPNNLLKEGVENYGYKIDISGDKGQEQRIGQVSELIEKENNFYYPKPITLQYGTYNIHIGVYLNSSQDQFVLEGEGSTEIKAGSTNIFILLKEISNVTYSSASTFGELHISANVDTYPFFRYISLSGVDQNGNFFFNGQAPNSTPLYLEFRACSYDTNVSELSLIGSLTYFSNNKQFTISRDSTLEGAGCADFTIDLTSHLIDGSFIPEFEVNYDVTLLLRVEDKNTADKLGSDYSTILKVNE